MAMAAESAPADRMARAIGLVQMSRRFGPAIGPVIGGFVAGVFGLRQAFLVAAFLYLIAMVVMLSLYREPGRSRPVTEGREGQPSFRQVIKFEGLAVMMAVVFVMQYVDRSLGPVLPLFVAEVGVPFSLSAAAGAIGNHLCTWFLERFPPGWVILGSTVGAAGVAASLATMSQVLLLAVWLPLFGLAIGICTTAAYTVAGRRIPSGAEGVGFGVLSSASMVGLALSPVVSGLIGSVSIRGVFLVDAILLIGLGFVVKQLNVQTTNLNESKRVLP